MAENVVIRAERLSKKYVIGHEHAQERYKSLRDVIARNARNISRSVTDILRGRANIAGDELEEFWALKDVDFEIRRGDVVGIIGRNGAGKSTLLKILSRITDPSEGRVTIEGRVASLLEVGTGFHPELSGRENIYLNGAILGMTRAEIKRKFDEIVAFAGVEKFLDTPVKRYSSGMYVRLAFAVAAHLEPEILIVDEVLSVGDAEFQKKCLGKMKDVAGHGRTVLFVSHNMAAIRTLCARAFLVSSGSIQINGPVDEVVVKYLASTGEGAGLHRRSPTEYLASSELSDDEPRVLSASIRTSTGGNLHEYSEPLQIELAVRRAGLVKHPHVSIQLVNYDSQAIIHAYTDALNEGCSSDSELKFVCTFPRLRLNVGQYSLTIHYSGPPHGPHFETIEGACSFEVVRTRDTYPWGWRENACAYVEDNVWQVYSATLNK